MEISLENLYVDIGTLKGVNTITRVRFLDVNSNLCFDFFPFRQGK